MDRVTRGDELGKRALSFNELNREHLYGDNQVLKMV